MIPVSITIELKAGPISISFDTADDDVLHYITVAELASKVMELSNYVGPENDPPALAELNEVTTGSRLTRQNQVTGFDDIEDMMKSHDLAQPALFDDSVNDSVIEEINAPEGEVKGKVGSKDPVLSRFLEAE